MGLFDTIKNALGMGPDEDYDYDEPENEQNQVQPQNQGGFPQNDNYQPRNDMGDNNGNKRMNISVTAQLQVILVKPEKFSDTKEIANHLCNKKTVVLNLEATTPDVTRRIIDFLGGVAYANGGSIKPVANNTFIITPYNVGFQGDELSADSKATEYYSDLTEDIPTLYG